MNTSADLWLRHRTAWRQRPGRETRLDCYACGLSAAELSLRTTRKGSVFYQVRCGSCGLWGQTKHLGACFLAGMSSTYRQTSAIDLKRELATLQQAGRQLDSTLSWSTQLTNKGTPQPRSDSNIPCLFCGMDKLVNVRIDRTGRPYTPCAGCGSRAFYPPQSDSWFVSLGLAKLAFEHVEQWTTISRTGVDALAQVTEALRAPQAL